MLNDTTTWSHAPDNQVVPSRWQMTLGTDPIRITAPEVAGTETLVLSIRGS